MQVNCPKCGAQVEPQSRFCGDCGQSLSLSPEEPVDVFSPTLSSIPPPVSADEAPARTDAIAAQEPAKRSPRQSKTMLAGSIAQEPSARRAQVPETPKPASSPAQPTHPKKTMLGMSGPVELPAARPSATPSHAPAVSTPEPRSNTAEQNAGRGKTMLGLQTANQMAPPLSQSVQEPTEAPGATAPARPIALEGDSPETMSSQSGGYFGDESIALPGRSGTKTVGWILGIAFIVLVLGAGTWFVLGALQGPEFTAEYAWHDGGASLEVQTNSPGDELQVRWSDQTVNTLSGVASFRIDGTKLTIGERTFDIRWRETESDAWQDAKVTANVPFHVFTDRERLSRQPPELRVVVRAPAGSKVKLDERVIASSNDRFERVYTLKDVGPDDEQILHHSEFSIATPGGKVHRGTLIEKAPLAYLKIIQPPEPFVTSNDTVVLRGKVQDGASVELDGTSLRIRNGLFHSLFRLQAVGQYSPTLVVRQEGFVPRRRQLSITRVNDLRAAANNFEADETVDYAALQERPEAVQGRSVSFSGYVYHTRKTAHDTEVQVLLQECTTGAKCPAWVTYPAPLDISDRTWVDIRGYADGFQKFRTKDNKTDSIPRIRAVFLLPKTKPAAPSSQPRRKKNRTSRRVKTEKSQDDLVNPWR